MLLIVTKIVSGLIKDDHFQWTIKDDVHILVEQEKNIFITVFFFLIIQYHEESNRVEIRLVLTHHHNVVLGNYSLRVNFFIYRLQIKKDKLKPCS